jgi:glyoxylase-like metal-dependent hydrolase (beta-lactamase superfamily II)
MYSSREIPSPLPENHSATLQLAEWKLEWITAGRFWLDGGVMYGIVPKAVWQTITPADAQNRLPFAIRFLLARNGRHCVLIDTGQGDKLAPLDRKAHALEPGDTFLELLAQRGVQAGDVDAVVFSHLHWDHAGGATQFDGQHRLRPTFPNATYFVNREEWDDAASGAPELAGSYTPKDFQPFEESGQLVLTDGDAELLPGLWTRFTGGHTRGHQAILFASGQGAALIPGDICPAVTHLRKMWCTAYDLYPAETRRRKAQLLGEAADGGWWILWGHDPRIAISRLQRHGKCDFVAVDERET